MAENNGNTINDLKRSLEILKEKREDCYKEIETEFSEIWETLLTRKTELLSQVDSIIGELTKQLNEQLEQLNKSNTHVNIAPLQIAFTTDQSLKMHLKTFGDVHRKTQLQTKSPPPLTTLTPLHTSTQLATNVYNYQYSPFIYNPGMFQFSVPLDQNVREAHPTLLSDTKIHSKASFKPLCVKKKGDKFYVVSQDEFIYIIDEKEGKVLRRFEIKFSLFFPAITISGSNIVFGHSSQFGGKLWLFSETGETISEVVELSGYGRIKLLSDLGVTCDDKVIITDTGNHSVVIASSDLSKVVLTLGQESKLSSPTRVAVNSRNELHILHRRGTTVDVFNLKEERLKSFYLCQQAFASDHIRFNPDLLVTDDYMTLIFDNLIFVFNFKSEILSRVSLVEISGVLPKCVATTPDRVLAVKHDSILRYDIKYFD